MAVRRVSAAVSRAVGVIICRLRHESGLHRHSKPVLERLEERRLMAGGQWFKMPANGTLSYTQGSTCMSYVSGALSISGVPSSGWVQAESVEAAIRQYVSGTFTLNRTCTGGGSSDSLTFGSSSGFRVNDGTITLEDMVGLANPDNDYDDWSWNVDIKPFVDPGCECIDGKWQPLGEVHPGYECPQNTSKAPVNYTDGSVIHASVDLTSESFGAGFGHSRRWTNRVGTGQRNVNGSGFVVSQAPQLSVISNFNSGSGIAPSFIQVSLNASTSAWFDRDGSGTYVARFGRKDTLIETTVQDDNNVTRSAWRYADGSGQVAYFYGVGGTTANQLPERQRGALHSMTDTGGNVTDTTYDANGLLTEITRTGSVNGTSVTESMVYTYETGATNTDLIKTVTLRRKTGAGAWTGADTVRSVAYTYYVNADSYGAEGDLKLAEVKDAAGSVIESKYYRYYETGNALGYERALMYAVEGAAYDRLKTAAGGNVDGASNATVESYAQFYFEYDSDHRVTTEKAQAFGCSTCTGGYGTFTFAYTDSANAAGYNNWFRKTVETLPDGKQNIVYSNAFGQPILKVFKDGSSEWKDFYRYDTEGKLLLHASPASVTGYSESYADLVNFNTGTGSATHLSTSAGLIELRDYGTSTTAGTSSPGDVVGYLKSTSVKQGTGGTAVPTAAQAYIARSDGTTTTYVIGSETRYRNSNGTGAQTTTYSYTWQGSTRQMATRTVTRPAVTTAQNGSNATVATTEYFDAFDRTIWVVDEDSYITYNKYDEKTGTLIQQISDADPTLVSGAPVTGPTRNGSLPTAFHLSTTMAVDALGRVTKVTDPNGNVTYTTYNDVTHETRIYAGWNATTGTTTGPTRVLREDWARGYTERLTMSAAPATSGSAGSLVPTGTEAVGSVESLRRDILNGAGQVVEQVVYTSLAGTSYTQATAKFGTQGTNYLRTEIGYDNRGRKARVNRPDGTWEHTVYDGLGRVMSTWKGTDNTGWSHTNPAGSGSPNNMLKVSENIYDNGGVGDSNLTESRDVFGAGGSDFYATKYTYDFRNRMTGMRRPDKTAAAYTLDNLGQQTIVEGYADADTDFVIDSGELRGKTASSFDERGQLFESTVYEIDPSTGASPGTVRDALTTDYWYDARGNLAKSRSANGLQNKSVFDGVGRLAKTYITIDADETAYSEFNSITDDRVLEQNHIVYDLGGRVVHTLSMKRKNDSPSTGTFTPENSWSQSVINWYDAADRTIATANYGSELRGDYLLDGGAVSPTPTRNIYNRTSGTMIDSDADGIPNVAEGAVPATPTWATAEQNQKYIIAKYSYDSAGRLYRVADNQRWDNTVDQGRITQTNFDLAGRKIKLIENYVDGVANSNDMDFDRVTDYEYATTGQLSQIVAYNVRGSSFGLAVAQRTKFFYDSAIDKSWVTDTIYPDSDDTSTSNGTDGLYDRVETSFDRLGRKTIETDQRGVTHTFTYDTSGRLFSDSIGTGSLPTGVEGTVRTIEYGYDDQSRANLVTSKNAAASVVNQVKMTFDGWGNIIKSEQAHNGSVGAGTPAVQYAYADGATGGVAKYVRLDSVTYPNGRVIQQQYSTAGSDYDVLNRVDKIRDTTASKDLTDYAWVGAFDFAGEVKHPSVSNGLTLTFGFGGNLMLGWDRYGRPVKMQWRNTAGNTELDRFNYKYDNAGNRVVTDREVTVSGVTLDDNYSESFEYDGLNRLVDYRRGKLVSGIVPKSPSDSTNLLYRQSWATLDGSGNVSGVKLASQGNWMEWTVDTNGGTSGSSTTQSRAVNLANEIDTDETDGELPPSADNPITGNSWIDPIYDKAGNMTTNPKGQGSETIAVYFVYDGWNRVAGLSATQVPDTDLTDAGEVQYEYDGMGRRISKDFAGGTSSDEDTYFNENYQALEMRKAGSSNAYEQHVWDLRYIDAPILRYRDANASNDNVLEETLYATYDANFNITGLVQENQTFVERYVYTPYGDRIVLTGTFGSRSSTSYDWQLGHQGLRIDTESGTYYNRGRQGYHPGIGGFTQRDPLGTEYQDGMSLYQPYRGNPATSVDPNGMDSATVGLPGGAFGGFVVPTPPLPPPPPSEPPSSQGSSCDNICGPSIDSIFSSALVRTYYRMMRNTNARGKGWVLENGNAMDVTATAPSCASKNCSGTVMLCGMCMSNSQVNNIVYGFAGTLAGLGRQELVVAADLHNFYLSPNAVHEGPTQHGSYGVGISLVSWIKDRSRGTNVSSMCAYLTADPNYPKALGNSTQQGKYAKCKKCLNTAVPGVDFSRLGWQ